METIGRTEALSFANFAKAYLQTAQSVNTQVERGHLRLAFDAPIYLLIAHSFELYLKSALMAQGVSKEVTEQYGHNLLQLFDRVSEEDPGESWISSLSQGCRNRWKEKLRTARDQHQNRMIAAFGEAAASEEFGVYDNGVIGRSLPNLRNQVIWLSERHAKKGGKFRYLEKGIDSHLEITAFGLKENIPLRSIEWACEDIGSIIQNHYFPKRKRPRP